MAPSSCSNGCDMRRFRSFNHSTCETVLNLLEAVYLRLRKIVELQLSSLEWTIKVRTDTAELMNMRIAGLRK